MWWRTTQKEAVANRGEGNKVAMSEKVDAGELVGLLAYVDGAAVGWCSVGPREAYSRLGRSPALTPVDGQEPPPSTWSTVCFFVHRDRRKQRVAHELLAAAVAFAAAHGATAFEGYPVKPRDGRFDNNSAFPGTKSMYTEVGFAEVASKSPDRSIQMIMRRTLSGCSSSLFRRRKRSRTASISTSTQQLVGHSRTGAASPWTRRSTD